jgi:hypothetical protein
MNETKFTSKIGDVTSAKQKNLPTQAVRLEPCHHYDNWLVPEAESNPDAQFASRALDISRGTSVIARILAAHLLDLNAIASGGGDSTHPLLGENDTEALARLAVFSLKELHNMASNQVDRLNQQAEKGARA